MSTEAEKVAELALATKGIELFEVNGVPQLAVRDGITVEDYTAFMDKPKRLTASPVFQDVESFAAYVNTFKGKDSKVFSHDSLKTVGCIVDYHGPDNPRWGVHTPTLKVSHTDDWEAWSKICAGPITQTQFAEFVEDQIHNIAMPDAATLKNMVLRFEVLKETTFKSVRNLDNGDVSLTYIEDSERGNDATAKFPTEMVLMVPVFEGQVSEQIKAKIRYRLEGPKLKFHLSLIQDKEIVKKAFNEVLEAVDNLTGIKPLRCP